MKRLRLYISLLLLIPSLLLVWLTLTESGLRWIYAQTEPYLPGEIKLNTVSGRLIGPITATEIEFQQNGTRISAQRLDIDWLPLTLFAAYIDISRLQIQGLEIVLPETDKTNAHQTQLQDTSLPDINLPWRMVVSNAGINGFKLVQDEQVFNLNQVSLNASTFLNRIDIELLSISADNFRLDIKGKLQPEQNYHHDLEIHWSSTLPSGATIESSGQLAGDLLKTRINQNLSGPVQLALDGELTDLLNQPRWQARIDVAGFDTSQLDSTWPLVKGSMKLNASGDADTAAVTGNMHGDYTETGSFDADFNLQRLSDNSIRVNQLKLHVPAGDTLIESNGSWTASNNGGDMQLAMKWSNLRWPVQSPWFSSASGSGSIAGNIDDYQIQLNSDSPWPELLPSAWTASASGNAAGMVINSLKVKALNGEALASGRLDWSSELNWQFEASASNIDPASLWPEWPGELNASLSSSGRVQNDKLNITADISELSGSLRSYPVSLRSRLAWSDDRLEINHLEFHSGTALLNAQGHIGETLELDWNIVTSNMAELYPEALGQLKAEGRLTGPRSAPTIQATFNGESLKLQTYAIGSIDAALAVDLFSWQQLDIRLKAEALQLNDYALQSLDIISDHNHIEATAVSDKLTAQVALSGKPETNSWSGRIERFDISSRQFDNWQLRSPATLSITSNSVHSQPLCWFNNDSYLCAELQKQDNHWQAKLEAEKMPLLLLGPWLPSDLKLEGKVNATARLHSERAGKLLGQVSIILPAGVVTYPLLEGERDRWDYQGGTLSITLDEQGVTTKSAIAMSNGDRFEFNAELPGARLLELNHEQQGIRADASLKIHDLGLFEALLPEVQDFKGEAGLHLIVSGTLAQPRLSGRAQLLNASLRLPRLGLTIDQISLHGQSDRFEKINFRAEARSGDGKLVLQGQTTLDKNAGWPTEISIKGNDFEVARIPEAKVLVSPDLQLKLKQRRIDVQGDVHVPYAKLQPKDITTAARASSDAVIVGNEQQPEDNWLVFTRIRLSLGERVSFYGFGFEGRFGGNLLLEDEPGQLTRATGEINIPEGRYRAYGQRLDVEHGRLLYTGGPLMNPGLDLRAVRHVENVTAGIRVRGSLDQPQLELFSSPAMGQTDALAYLMLGGPIEGASGEQGEMMAKAALALGLSGGDHLARTLGERFGLDEMRIESSDEGDQASLVVGRYLSPRLYVSYGVGLVETINTLTLRYKLSDQWQLKAESGEYQGADIFYTFER